MMNVLLESNAARTRRVGGTLTSALVHGAIIAGAVMLTVQAPRRIDASPSPVDRPIYRLPLHPQQEHPPAQTSRPTRTAQPDAPIPTLPSKFTFADPKLPTVDVAVPSGPTSIVGVEAGPGLPPVGAGSAIGLGGPVTDVVDERLVDRAPRLIGRAEPPAFPSALRAAGKNGRVLVQFVVDTLGRAEMAELRIVEAADPLFGEAVRHALPRYRFSPGEAGGRKVRTLVQLPFDFTLVR